MSTDVGVHLDAVVQAAVRAPSVHNTQPWRFGLGDKGLTLHADRSRTLTHLDPDGRQLLISCGAALAHARLAVRCTGRVPEVTLLPDPDDPDLLARLRVGAHRATTPLEMDLQEAATRRRTFRGSFSDTELPEGLTHRLRSVATAEGAFLHLVSRREDQLVAAALLERATAREESDPAYREELDRWTRSGEVSVDGVPATPDAAGHDDVFVLRDFGSGGHGRWGRGGEVIVLGTDTDDPRAWLQAGQALGLVLLHLTLEGAAASPLGQVLDLPDSRAQLRALLGLGGHPQMVLRIGMPDSAGTPGRASGRRPVSDVIDPR